MQPDYIKWLLVNMGGTYQHSGFAVNLSGDCERQAGTYGILWQTAIKLSAYFLDEIAAFLLRASEFYIVLQFSFYVVF